MAQDPTRWTAALLAAGVAASAGCSGAPADTSPPWRASEADVASVDAGAPPSGALVYHHVFLSDHLPTISGLAVSPAGDVWIAGSFAGTLQIGDTTLTSAAGAGGTDVFVARLDAAGNPRSSARVGSPAYDGYEGLALDGAGNVVLAYGNAPTSLVKLDATGNVLWQKDILQPAPILHDADLLTKVEVTAPDGAGGMLLVNTSDGRLQVGSSLLRGLHHVLVDVDANGEVAWSASVGPGGYGSDEYAVGIAVDGMGHVIVGESDARGEAPWVYAYDGTGARLWTRRIGASWFDMALCGVAAGPQGDVLLSGRGSVLLPGFQSTGPGPWLVALDPSGAPLWLNRMAGGKLALDSAGDAYLATGTAVTKLDPTGAVVWRWSAPSGDATIGGVAVDPAGHLVVAGTFRGEYDFGDGPIDSGAGGAIFAMALDP